MKLIGYLILIIGQLIVILGWFILAAGMLYLLFGDPLLTKYIFQNGKSLYRRSAEEEIDRSTDKCLF